MKWREIVACVKEFYRSEIFKIDILDDSEYSPEILVSYVGPNDAEHWPKINLYDYHLRKVYSEKYVFRVAVEIDLYNSVGTASLNASRKHQFWSVDELKFALRDFSKFLKFPCPELQLEQIHEETLYNDPNYDPYY